jgi:glucokinase
MTECDGLAAPRTHPGWRGPEAFRHHIGRHQTEMQPAKLIADIGGTNARFAIARDGTIAHARVLPTAAFPTLQAAAREFLSGLPADLRVTRAALDLAGPVVGDHARLTNGVWSFSISQVKAELGFDELVVLNDFAAAALGIPLLDPSDYIAIGGGVRDPRGPIGVIGPGTGLGVAGLVFADGRWVVLPGEGGHGTMPAATREEGAILDLLRDRLGHVSAERVLSGHGLQNLHTALCTLAGVTPPPLTDHEITAAALAGSDATSARVLDLFCEMLGTVAGNLALTLGASGGVFLIGGILPRFAGRFAASGFRARFEAKGRLAEYMRAIPTYLVTHDNPALLGLAGLP